MYRTKAGSSCNINSQLKTATPKLQHAATNDLTPHSFVESQKNPAYGDNDLPDCHPNFARW
jgi:hypothetical protein